MCECVAWHWSYRQLLDTQWVLGIRVASSEEQPVLLRAKPWSPLPSSYLLSSPFVSSLLCYSSPQVLIIPASTNFWLYKKIICSQKFTSSYSTLPILTLLCWLDRSQVGKPSQILDTCGDVYMYGRKSVVIIFCLSLLELVFSLILLCAVSLDASETHSAAFYFHTVSSSIS